MSLSSTPTLTPYAAGDTGSTTNRTAAMPTVADGDAAILAVMTGLTTTPTIAPEVGWTSPWTLVVALSMSGKSLTIWKATDLSASDSGKLTTITTSSSAKVTRIIEPIRGGSLVDIVDTYASSNGTSNTTASATPPLTTTTAGCGSLHILGIRRNDGVAGDWFTALDANSGQGVTEDAQAFSSTSSLGASLNALVAVRDWTPRALGATIPAINFTSDKAGTYYGVTLSIRPGNIAPVADAGPDVEVDAGDTAYITDATASDEDGTVVSTDWTWVSYPTTVAPTITDDDTLTPNFPTTTAGEYKLLLTVEDNNGAVSTDEVSVWAVTDTPEIYEVVNDGGWSPFGTADPIDALSDADDSTGIRSSASPSNDSYTARWQPMPAGAKTFEFDLRNQTDSPTTSCTLTLLNRDTGTTIATLLVTGLTTTKQEIEWVLTPTENANVLDSHKIDMRWTANI